MLTIEKRQLRTLDESSHSQFERQCADFLRERFPEIDAYSMPQAQLSSVRAGIASARFQGLQNEDDVVLYLYLRQLLGAGFDARADTPVGLAMSDATLAPAARLQLAAERAGGPRQAA